MNQTAQAPGSGRPVATLGELQRAWHAVQAGRFRSATRPGITARPADCVAAKTKAAAWYPAETVVPVIGAGGGVGATTLALALASASTAPARVVECCSAAASGLAGASTAELGVDGSGWRRGLRDGLHHRVLLERAAGPITAASAVPLPTDSTSSVDLTDAGRPGAVTFLDCGWDLDHLLAEGWLAQLVADAHTVVVAASATVPGLRRLEVTVASLPAARVVAGVLGPRRRRWGRPVEGSLGPATRGLDTAGDLVEIPLDRHLGVHGLTGAPLPQPLLVAASHLLDRLPPPALDDHHPAHQDHPDQQDR